MNGYSECFETISRLAPAVQSLFADPWYRFPVAKTAETIISELDRQRDFWKDRNQDNTTAIDETIKAIRYSSFKEGAR